MINLLKEQNLSPTEDMYFQFESVAEKLHYECSFLQLKNEKLVNKLENNLVPRKQRKFALKEVLEALYEGKLKHEGKELGQYASKMATDSQDKELQILDKESTVHSQS